MRVAIFSASVGAGHTRAGQAVELALKDLRPDADVRHIDVLSLTNAAFRRLYGKAYLDLVNHAPHLLGAMYDLLDRPSRSGKDRSDRLRQLVEKVNLAPFIRQLREDPADLVINTHFLPAGIIASLRRARKIRQPQVSVVTDFDAHRLWVNEPCDHYFVATEEAKATLANWKIDAARISVTGIPIHPAFGELKRPAEIRAKLGVAGDRPVVLQLAGGFGVGPIEDVHRSLLATERPIELVTVTGKNAAAKATLEAVPCPRIHRRQVLGFTTAMDEWLAVADVVVSKPGGLTTSEVLARGTVMLILDPIPGQESRNSDYLLEEGAAIKANGLAVLRYKLGRLLDDPKRLAAMKTRARALGHPESSKAVAEASLAMVSR